MRAVQAAASTRAATSSLIVHDKSNNFGYAVLHKVCATLIAEFALKNIVMPLTQHALSGRAVYARVEQVNRFTVQFSRDAARNGSRARIPVHEVVTETIDAASAGVQGVNVAVLDCEGHELHALCGAMTLLMKVRSAAAAYAAFGYDTANVSHSHALLLG